MSDSQSETCAETKASTWRATCQPRCKTLAKRGPKSHDGPTAERLSMGIVSGESAGIKATGLVKVLRIGEGGGRNRSAVAAGGQGCPERPPDDRSAVGPARRG